MSQRKRCGAIGVDVGARRVNAAQLCVQRDGSVRVEAMVTIPRAAGASPGLDTGEARRIADVLYRRGFEGNELVLAVPDDRLMTANLELPPRNADVPLDQIARSEFARTLKADSDEFEFAYWDLPAPARASRATHVMGVGCRHADSEPFLDAFADAGMEVAALEVAACALTRACAPWIPPEDEIIAVVDIGWCAARLLVAHRGVVCYQRALAGYGVERLHRALGEHFGVAAAELIEHVVRSTPLNDDADVAGGSDATLPAASKSEAQHAMRTHLDAILAEVMTSLAYSSHQYPDAAVRRVLLCGGGANLFGAAEYLSARHKLDVRPVRPVDLGTLAPAIERVAESADASMMLALGLAGRDAAHHGAKAMVAA